MREKYFAGRHSCKVAVSFGQDPLLYFAGGTQIPHGVSEYEWRKILSERSSNGAKPKEEEPVGVESGSTRSAASRTERKR